MTARRLMNADRGTRVALAVMACVLGSCATESCPCDVEAVVQSIAGADARDCGVATSDAARPGVEACVADAFSSGGAFSGLWEIPASAPALDGTVLIRGFVRGGDGVLHEVVATRQPNGTLVHTRLCFAAEVTTSASSGDSLTCTDRMDGLFRECEHIEPPTNDGGAADAR